MTYIIISLYNIMTQVARNTFSSCTNVHISFYLYNILCKTWLFGYSKSKLLKQKRSFAIRYGNIFFFKWPNIFIYGANCWFPDRILRLCTYVSNKVPTVGRKKYMSETWRGTVVMCIVLNNVFVSVSYS